MLTRDGNKNAIRLLLGVSLLGMSVVTVANTYYLIFKSMSSPWAKIGITIAYVLLNDATIWLMANGLRDTYDTAIEKIIGYSTFAMLVFSMSLGLVIKASEGGYVTFPEVVSLNSAKMFITVVPVLSIIAVMLLWYFDPQAHNARITTGLQTASKKFNADTSATALKNMRSNSDLGVVFVEMQELKLILEAIEQKASEFNSESFKRIFITRSLTTVAEKYGMSKEELAAMLEGDSEPPAVDVPELAKNPAHKEAVPNFVNGLA